MNHSQAQAILEAGGLSHLMEAAAALARLTGRTQLTSSSEHLSNTMPQSSVNPMMMPPVSALQQQHHHNIQQTLNSQSQTESRNLMQQPNIIFDEDNIKQTIQQSVEFLSTKGISSGGNKEIFPERLMALLNDTSLSEVITWLPHGRSFVIIRPDVFTESVLPKYFPPVDSRSSSKYTSFTRKLNRWGFRQATRGADTGAFHHPLFRRDKPELCLDMVCQRFGGSGGGDKSSDKAGAAKKRGSPSTSAKVKTLTKEVLQHLSEVPKPTADVDAPTTAPTTQAVAAVSDDGRSTSSNNTEPVVLKLSEPTINGMISATGCSQSATTTTAFVSGITNDAELTRVALLKRNETERLRAAKAMLYESYCRAIRGE